MAFNIHGSRAREGKEKEDYSSSGIIQKEKKKKKKKDDLSRFGAVCVTGQQFQLSTGSLGEGASRSLSCCRRQSSLGNYIKTEDFSFSFLALYSSLSLSHLKDTLSLSLKLLIVEGIIQRICSKVSLFFRSSNTNMKAVTLTAVILATSAMAANISSCAVSAVHFDTRLTHCQLS